MLDPISGLIITDTLVIMQILHMMRICLVKIGVKQDISVIKNSKM